MADNILVTTDLSNNSKAGIRFAIQLAAQRGSYLIFYYAMELLKPARWNDRKFKEYSRIETAAAEERLDRFVKDVYRRMGMKPGAYECVVEIASSAGKAIVNYARKRGVSFICISTHGAGRLRRLIGTHTSYVIKHSSVPVLAIPKNYRRTPLSHVLYASDLTNLKDELDHVKEFANSTASTVSVVHFDSYMRPEEMKERFEKLTKQYRRPGIEFHLRHYDWEKPLTTNLKRVTRQLKPSVVALFTKQDRNWFERMFLSSKSAEASFKTERPLLIFPKKMDG